MSEWGNVFEIIRDASPLIGEAISNSNPISALIMSVISKVFGANKYDPKDVFDKIRSDPEYKLKLKKIEFDHEDELIRANSSDYKIEVEDRTDARQKQVNIHDWVPTFLAVGFLINYAAIQFYCVFNNSNVNDIISARFQDVLIMIMSYYFGSMHKKTN